MRFVFIIENYNDPNIVADVENRMRVLFEDFFVVANESTNKLYGVSKCYTFSINSTSNYLYLKKLCALSKDFPNVVFSIIDNDYHNKKLFVDGLFRICYPKIVYSDTEVSEFETYDDYMKEMSIIVSESFGY